MLLLNQDITAQNLIIRDVLSPQLFKDCWMDAGMPSVLAYLRGDRHVHLPESLRRLLPANLPLPG